MIAPCIKPGGTIGICSPSHIVDRERMGAAIASMRRNGFRVLEADNLYKTTYGYMSAPQERAADFNQLVRNPEVDLILFGGGECSNELIPYLDFESIRKNPKRICSYSDGTTILNTIWANTKLEVYYGQTPYVFNEFCGYNAENFKRHLVDGNVREHFSNSPWQVQTEGAAEGVLIGGYSRNLALLLGNKYFPIDLNERYLLFVEDHEQFGGVGYVSAMLSAIEQHDFIHRVTGLVFGHYSENTHPDLLRRLKRLGEEHQIPVVYCDDFGHGANRAILRIGHWARLDTGDRSLRYL